MNRRRARAKGKMHPRNDEGRVVNHAMCAMATETMTSWTIAKTDERASERTSELESRLENVQRAYVCTTWHLRVHVSVCGGAAAAAVRSGLGEKSRGREIYRKLDGVRGVR